MIISQSIFGALCTLKYTDLELFIAAMSYFDMSGFIKCGSYSRYFMSLANNKSVLNSITIRRVIRKGSLARHTHAILLRDEF